MFVIKVPADLVSGARPVLGAQGGEKGKGPLWDLVY